MRHQLLPLLATIALLGAACSQTSDTTVVALGEGTETPVDAVEVVTIDESDIDEPDTDEPVSPLSTDPVEADEEAEPGDEATTTLPPVVEEPPVDDPPFADEPPVIPGAAWEDQPLARTVLTDSDLAALGLGADWETETPLWWEFDDGDDSDGDTVCGAVVPTDRSQFLVSSFSSGSTLDLLTIPANGDAVSATGYLAAFELLATCPDLEEEYEAISVELLNVAIEGADESVVITGVDGDIGDGITMAGAVVDGHLFLAYVSQDDGNPVAGDVELVVAAIELSISRL